MQTILLCRLVDLARSIGKSHGWHNSSFVKTVLTKATHNNLPSYGMLGIRSKNRQFNTAGGASTVLTGADVQVGSSSGASSEVQKVSEQLRAGAVVSKRVRERMDVQPSAFFHKRKVSFETEVGPGPNLRRAGADSDSSYRRTEADSNRDHARRQSDPLDQIDGNSYDNRSSEAILAQEYLDPYA